MVVGYFFVAAGAELRRPHGNCTASESVSQLTMHHVSRAAQGQPQPGRAGLARAANTRDSPYGRGGCGSLNNRLDPSSKTHCETPK